MSSPEKDALRPLPRLVSRTSALTDVSEAAAMLQKADVIWSSPGTKMGAFGAAWKHRPSRSPGRFEEAALALRSMYSAADIDDPLDVPGSGPVALGTFSFDWADSSSCLLVPSVIYGMSETTAWKTEIKFDPARDDLDRSSTVDNDIQFGRHSKTGRESGSESAPQTGPGKASGTSIDSEGPTAPTAAGDSNFADWQNKFDQVRRALDSKQLEKVVLARRTHHTAQKGFDRWRLIRTLAREFPGCYTFCFGRFLGASPELLVRKLGPVVDSMPIAGSSARSEDEAADARLGAELMASSKDRREHGLTKAAVIAALTPFCSELEAEPEPSLLQLSNVQHLSTKVQGRLDRETDCMQLLQALHPTPAVCGVPPEQALETIRLVEGFSRGRYAGPVGWMDHRGDGEWAIALRCAELESFGATLFAGAGIVAESDAKAEYEETELKLQAIRSALVQA